jgi:hypothetical protein
MYIGLHVKYPLFLSDNNKTWIFSADFRKVLKYQISRKSVQWEQSCSMRPDRRTDMTKLIVAFRTFANASNNVQNHFTVSLAQLSNSPYTQNLLILQRCFNCWGYLTSNNSLWHGHISMTNGRQLRRKNFTSNLTAVEPTQPLFSGYPGSFLGVTQLGREGHRPSSI